MNQQEFPFVYGAQYYRAPTPEPEFWENDLAKLKSMGCNTVKYWVQWRWSERKPGEYFWDDLDQLMRLAEKYELKVILNLICDVMPVWAEKLHPDCIMVNSCNLPVPTEAVICRQIGGYPGPCYNHPEMLAYRQNFFKAALEHFRQFPALLAWDVWNEPERHLGRRGSKENEHLLCYCHNCRRKFIQAMEKKYVSIDKLNVRWGRCYSDFDEVELPTNPLLVGDYIDWREFQLDTLTEEAYWRLDMVRRYAPGKFPHLHVVPHTIHCFNSANCVDDYALAQKCEIFGSTMMNDPFFVGSACSSAGEKLFYNAEWHINFGSSSMHPRTIDRTMFLREAIPQLGWNVRGYLYWQFRPERLGMESPAWGLIRSDGSDKPVTKHASEFIQKLSPHLPELMRTRRKSPAVGVLKSRRNELYFNGFPQNKGNWLYRSIRGWMNCLRKTGLPFCFLSVDELENENLDSIRLLILPAANYMSQKEADAADAFLRNGGTVIVEGSVASYLHDSNRYTTVLPGCGLAEKWGIRETESVSTFHLDCSGNGDSASSGVSGDTAKALSSVKTYGGEFLPLSCADCEAFGALNLSVVTGENLNILASYQGQNCIVEKSIGKGRLIYAGTYLGIAAAEHSDEFVCRLLKKTGLPTEMQMDDLYLTPLYEKDKVVFYCAENRSQHPRELFFSSECLDVFNDKIARTFLLEPESAAFFKVL